MNIPRRSLFSKLNRVIFGSLDSAVYYSKLRNNSYTEICHWFWHIWQLQGTDLHCMVAHQQLDAAQIELELRSACAQQPHDPAGLRDFGQQVLTLAEKAWIHASLVQGDTAIRSAWLLATMLGDVQLRLALQSCAPTLLKLKPPVDPQDWQALLKGSCEQHEVAYDATDLPSSAPGESSNALAHNPASGDALCRYCTDLTAKASRGELDAVVGRDHEIRTMIDILLRRRQNNPLLTGEAGVGKTAVVEGLALAVAKGDVPPALKNIRLLSLDVGALLAGASMRGEFESRLKQLLQQAQDSEQPVILFIDEVHTLIGAGGRAGTGDAANLLKPALARGGLRTIGATTWSEFKKHIEKDPALTRRFQVQQIHEPEISTAMAMVRSLAHTLAQHHGVVIDNVAVEASVTLSHRYIPARQLPDKAISLLDTACARVAMSQHAVPANLLGCRAQISELRTRLQLCEQDHSRTSEHAHDLENMRTQLQTLQARELLLVTEWEQQKQMVQALQQTWKDGIEHAPSSSDTAARSRELQDQLKHAQGEDPMVHAQVHAGVVASVVSDWTGIPVGKMLSSDLKSVRQLESTLSQRVKGQPDALRAIAQRVQIAKTGLTDPNKPVGVFMLAGPSGVGKTETALALADAIYGGEHNLITLNMSEFQESHTISTIKGSPPGYVGYGEGGVLTEAVRRRPYSVVLLDEVEKAHPDVHELFYQVFDKGWLEDGEGRQIDFRNTLILLTSNVGADLLTQLCDDPALQPEQQTLADAIQPELRKVFPAAFLGRIAVVPYLPLSSEVVAQIVNLQVAKVIARMKQQHQVDLNLSDAALTRISQAAGAMEIGGRRIAQHIERHVLPVLSSHWLENMQSQSAAQSIVLDWGEGQGYLVQPQKG